MRTRRRRRLILWYECVGFVGIIAFLWLEEAVDLSSLLFGGAPHTGNWRQALMSSVIVVLVWAVVVLLTRRLLAHLLYLDGFLRVCAWCRRVGYHERWLRLEDYFAQGFHVATTHGVCPECLKKLEEDTAIFRRKEQEQQQAQISS